jgi:hypothetical protein
MITVKLLGGLGNQLFQLAFSMALESRGYKTQLNRDSLVEGTHREYSLEHFGYFPTGTSQGPNISEKSLCFNEAYLNPPDPCTMYGYWQSEKYFKNVEGEVRQLFKNQAPCMLRDSSNPSVVEAWNRIYYSDSIALHIRRQDYLRLQHFHGMPSLDYYRTGIEDIRSRRYNTSVFIFSDDRQWCRENFSKDCFVVDGTNKYEDLRLMSQCNHAVIANSSFSWWGAWLQQKLGGIIVAPKHWFADPTIDDSDIVPARWMKV